jgi:hypothetical protein
MKITRMEIERSDDADQPFVEIKDERMEFGQTIDINIGYRLYTYAALGHQTDVLGFQSEQPKYAEATLKLDIRDAHSVFTQLAELFGYTLIDSDERTATR